jgi:hypothetical protein
MKKLSSRMRRLTNKFRESAIYAALFALVVLGWRLALQAHNEQVKDEQHQQQNANDLGGEDAWLSSLTR